PDALEVWDLFKPKPTSQTLAGKVGPVTRAAFSPDSRVLVVGGTSGVQLWKREADGWQEFAVLNVPGNWTTSPSFAADGSVFAAISNVGVHVWDAATWEELHRWKVPGVQSLALSSDGRHLALGNFNGTIYLLRLAAPEEPSRAGTLVVTTPEPDVKVFV